MGIIDPMIISSAANGVIQYGDGQMLLLVLLGVLGAAGLSFGMSAWRQLRAIMPGVPRPSGVRLVAAGAAAK